MLTRVLKIVLPLVILLAGVGIFMALVASRPKVEPQKPEPIIPLVRVVIAQPQDVPLTVQAQGTVMPRTETTLAAQVAAQVVAVARSFEAGGFFEAGDVLVTLDERDFRFAIEAARARVAQAELRLWEQEAEAKVARGEWEELGEGDAVPLVLREPQLAEAAAALSAARAELRQAELAEERARIRAPFAGRLRAKLVDVGQYVTPGQGVAKIHAVDYAEIRLPIPHREMAYLDMPLRYRGAGHEARGPAALIEADFTGRRHAWPSRIVRTEGEVDERTRMLYLVARVGDPYGRNGGRPPLAVGVFVEATIDGITVPGAVLLPREAMRNEGQVLVVDGEDRLRFRDVEVVRYQGEEAVIGSGLAAGEKVCVSPLDVVVDGMRVQTTEVEAPLVTARNEDFDSLVGLSGLDGPPPEIVLPDEPPAAVDSVEPPVEEAPVREPPEEIDVKLPAAETAAVDDVPVDDVPVDDVPVDDVPPEEDAPTNEIQVEELPLDDAPGADIPTLAIEPPADTAGTDTNGRGSDEGQRWGPARIGRSLLLTAVALGGDEDGAPLTVTLRLQQPAESDVEVELFRLPEDESRVVLDLHGVVNVAAGSPLDITAGGLRRVRFSQHQLAPEPTTRVVFDLENVFLEPEIRRQDDGIAVVFR